MTNETGLSDASIDEGARDKDYLMRKSLVKEISSTADILTDSLPYVEYTHHEKQLWREVFDPLIEL